MSETPAPAAERSRRPGAPVRVALLGCGTVGSAVVRLLSEHAEDLTARIGVPVQLVGIAVRDPARNRDLPVPPGLFTADAAALVATPGLDVVVELMGGIEPARSLLLDALDRGTSVVTANKALLAEDGATLADAAEKAHRDLSYEAAVGAAIPLIRPLRESLAGDRVRRVVGILNGTTNFVLDRMDRDGVELADALAEAQAHGFAEQDPTADIGGADAAAKAAILSSLAFSSSVTAADVDTEGIAAVTAADVAAARDMGCVLKLLAVCETTEPADAPGERVVVSRVHPAMVPREHPLAAVHGANNAVVLDCEAAGRLMFYGPGAGGRPTAAAVLGDVVDAARNLLAGVRGPVEPRYSRLAPGSVRDTVTRHHVRLRVEDRPGVLACVAEAFAHHGLSVSTVRQEGSGSDAGLVLVTHPGREAALAATVAELRELGCVSEVAAVIRVEDGG